MQFIVLGYDGEDEGAVERRRAVREAHLRGARAGFEAGSWSYAAAILDDEGGMIGSLIVCEFPSRRDLEEQWLAKEPYVLGDVWREIQIHRAQVAPLRSP
jgi:uncharacterized protein YciI